MLLTAGGMLCDCCGICINSECKKKADRRLKCKQVSCDSLSMKHHWIKGTEKLIHFKDGETMLMFVLQEICLQVPFVMFVTKSVVLGMVCQIIVAVGVSGQFTRTALPT